MVRSRLWLIVVCGLSVLFALSGWNWRAELDAGPTAGQLSRPGAAELAAPDAAVDDVKHLPSPDGLWVAVVNRAAGSLEIQRAPDGPATFAFPPGSTVDAASWSPDSRRLVVVRNNWTWKEPRGSGVEVMAAIELWHVALGASGVETPTRVFQSEADATETLRGDSAEQIVLGSWSPDSRHVLFWLGPLGASVLADGLPVYALDVQSAEATRLADGALLNPRYHSWSPDGAALVLTAGYYRSALINKWLVVYNTATAQVTTVISSSEQIPGSVAWSPRDDVIAYAAVPAEQASVELADLMTWDNPAIAGRRIYLLDPTTAQHGRLNSTETFQDAPLWSDDGLTLYYVERQANDLVLMAAEPATGAAAPVPGARLPLPEYVGYYGQFDPADLLAERPVGNAATPGAATAGPSTLHTDDQDLLRFVFERHAAEIGDLSRSLLEQVARGEFSDYSRQDVDLNDDGRAEMLISGRGETFYLFVTILARDPAGELRELYYAQITEGKYQGEVRTRMERRPLGADRDWPLVVADFLTLTGGTGALSFTLEQRWIACQPGGDHCQTVWSAPLLQAERNVHLIMSRGTTVAAVKRPDGQTIIVTTQRFGLSLPNFDWADVPITSTAARRLAGPDLQEHYRWDGAAYRLASRTQLEPGLEIVREVDAHTAETIQLVHDMLSVGALHSDGSFDGDAYTRQYAETWGLPAPGQADDPAWGSAWRKPDAAAYRQSPGQTERWIAGVVGALDRPQCRLSVLREAGQAFSLVGRLVVPCTPAFTRLMWVDITGDGEDDLVLLTAAPEVDALAQVQRLHLYTVSDGTLTELATLEGVINGADGIGVRVERAPGGGWRLLAGLPLVDPDAHSLDLDDIRLERVFRTYVWDAATDAWRVQE